MNNNNLENLLGKSVLKVGNGLKYALLGCYFLPTLHRINYEKKNPSKLSKEEIYDRGLTLGVGCVVGSLVNTAIVYYAGMTGLINDESSMTSMTAFSIPLITNIFSSFYESRRLEKNKELIEKGSKYVKNAKEDISNDKFLMELGRKVLEPIEREFRQKERDKPK